MLLDQDGIRHTIMQMQKRKFARNGYIESAVLLLFFDRADETFLTYIRRTHGPNPHSGHMAFPGGKIEHSDKSSYAAAARETYEEIGVPETVYEHLGEMGYFETLTSRYDASAHVARCYHPPAYKKDDFEVADIIEIPLALLQAQYRADLDRDNEHEVMYLNFKYVAPTGKEANLWGLTARITHEFLDNFNKMRIS